MNSMLPSFVILDSFRSSKQDHKNKPNTKCQSAKATNMDILCVEDLQNTESRNNLSLTRDLLLYFERQSKDVRVICQDRSFFTNSTLLAARSPVFERMLGPTSVFSEGQCKNVEINDFQSNIVEAFLDVVQSDR